MSNNKVLGGVLLVSGTTIGAGLLGLPAMCSFMGFVPSVILFMIVWGFMLATGFYFVDVTCDIKKKVNMISMAEHTIGRWGMFVSWISYLLLLYSLMALYIAACAPLFQVASITLFNIEISLKFAMFFLPLFFGWVIYLGVTGVDMINRFMMIGLVVAYFLLVSLLPTHIQWQNLTQFEVRPFLYALPAVITGFGYHIIIPTLGSYMHYNRSMMLKSVIYGSIISLAINIIWVFLVLGALPLETLAMVWKGGGPITPALASFVPSGILSIGVYLFSFFAILTSFLGVALSLADFLIDGLKIKKGWEGRLLAIALTFIPPLMFVYSYQKGFMLALQYAGAFVAILLVFIPSAMVWKLKGHNFYQSSFGKAIIMATIAFSFLVILVNILNQWDFFTQSLEQIGGLIP